MKLLFFVIFLSGCQGLAGPPTSGPMGVLINDSSIPGQPWFNLTVNRGNCYNEDDLYGEEGNVGESLVLPCRRLPRASFNYSITWKKNCLLELPSRERELIFQSLMKSDAGNYTCTVSFSNRPQVYTKTYELKVNERRVVLDPEIIDPRDNAEIKVDVGKAAGIPCVAVGSEFEVLFWMQEGINDSVSEDASKPVFYNRTEKQKDGKYHMNASLVFRNVTPEHLYTKYICILNSPGPSINVSITLIPRERQVVLDPKIIDPWDNAEIKVDVGQAAVIPCVAVVHSEPEYEVLFWMQTGINDSVSEDHSKPVFYKKTEKQIDGKYFMNASLVFRRVTSEHLYTKYTCKLDSPNPSINVTITLIPRERQVVLDPKIIDPRDNAEIKVDVGQAAVISCVAVVHSEPEYEVLFWMQEGINDSLSQDPSKPVFYNRTEKQKDGKYYMNASLVFRRVTSEHLYTKYTCKLDSPGPSVNVTITLIPRGDAPSPFLWLGIAAMFTVIASVFTVICVKLKRAQKRPKHRAESIPLL